VVAAVLAFHFGTAQEISPSIASILTAGKQKRAVPRVRLSKICIIYEIISIHLCYRSERMLSTAKSGGLLCQELAPTLAKNDCGGQPLSGRTGMEVGPRKKLWTAQNPSMSVIEMFRLQPILENQQLRGLH
jgi:hypothetical protein